ncbi:unnamed protein product, partial [Musa acuminata subsp. burmannicoides]
YNKASSIIVLIFYYFYRGIRAACLEQALFSLPIHHWCCHSAPTSVPFRYGISSAAHRHCPTFLLVVAIFLPLTF